MGDEDVGGGALRVGGAAGVVPRVLVPGVRDHQVGHGLGGARVRGDVDAAAASVVVDHVVVVVPEHVLGRRGALR